MGDLNTVHLLIKNMQPSIQNIYIDTYYFQGYLWGRGDEKENAKVIFSKIKRSVEINPNINVKVPFIIAGEFINNLIREKFGQREEIMRKFFELLRDLKAEMIPPNKCCYDKAKLLIDQDEYLGERAPTDTFIASCALCDQDSSHLLIHDTLLLESDVLRNLKLKMFEDGERNRDLKITGEF
jgi:hypothetical protein